MDRASRTASEEALRRRARLGVFTREMALTAGFTPKAIRYRLDSGRWQRFTGAAYLDPQHPQAANPGPKHRATAALLTWPDAVVGLRTAGVLLGFPLEDDGVTHVICQPKRRPTRGIRPHKLHLERTETARMSAFTVTSPRRTAIDCLAHLPAAEAERLLAWLITRNTVRAADIAAAADARRGWHGTAQLRHLAHIAHSGALSALERRLHHLLHSGGISGWRANAAIRLHGRIIAWADVLFDAEKLIVEVDGRAYHQDFDAERARMNSLTLAGYTVLRFTWRDLQHRPAQVLTEIRRVLRHAA